MTTPTAVASRYRIERRLGAGGMSTVFLALDGVLERYVAVKLLAEHLAEDDTFVARFRREALAAARLQHPNIVQVYDSGEDPESGRHYIVMEYVDGPSCADLLRDQGQLEIGNSVDILRDACRGLGYAHKAGVVHRDVKPGNLLLADDQGMTKLADFGIAKAAEQTRVTQVGSVLGTAAYLSPEQALGEDAGPASDIYSLGVVGYQFLTGRLPHEYGSLTELALKQQNDPVEPMTTYRPDVPETLDRAIRVCLARDPSVRYTSALDMAEAIDAGLRGELTAMTQRLEQTTQSMATSDDGDGGEPTHAMPATSAATRVAPPDTHDRRPDTGDRRRPAPERQPPRSPEPRRSEAPAAAPAGRSRRPMGRYLAAAALVIAGIVAAVIIASQSGGAGSQPIIQDDNVPGAVRELRQYIQENTEQ